MAGRRPWGGVGFSPPRGVRWRCALSCLGAACDVPKIDATVGFQLFVSSAMRIMRHAHHATITAIYTNPEATCETLVPWPLHAVCIIMYIIGAAPSAGCAPGPVQGPRVPYMSRSSAMGSRSRVCCVLLSRPSGILFCCLNDRLWVWCGPAATRSRRCAVRGHSFLAPRCWRHTRRGRQCCVPVDATTWGSACLLWYLRHQPAAHTALSGRQRIIMVPCLLGCWARRNFGHPSCCRLEPWPPVALVVSFIRCPVVLVSTLHACNRSHYGTRSIHSAMHPRGPHGHGARARVSGLSHGMRRHNRFTFDWSRSANSGDARMLVQFKNVCG